MEITFKALKTRDIKTISEYTIEGMHFNYYISNPRALKLSGKYFFLTNLKEATEVISAYDGDELLGVLLAKIKGGTPYKLKTKNKIFVKIIDWLSKISDSEGYDAYENANSELLMAYEKNKSYDGEILFIAANPRLEKKGIGSALLNELIKRQSGKTVIVNSDTSCSYQFYPHRGFNLEGSKKIVMKMPDHDQELECFLYSRTL